MFFGLGCIGRIAFIALVIFTLGSLAMAGLILASDGFSGSSVIDLPTVREQLTGSGQPAPPEEEAEEVAPGQINEVVDKRPLFESVPYISEVSTAPEVVGTNLSLAIFFAVIFGVLGTMLNNLLRDHEQEMEDWLEYFYIGRIFRLFQMAVGQEVRRGCLGLPIIILIFAAYGIIFTFLEPGASPLSPEGMQLAIVMAMSVGLVSLSGDMAQRQLARFWNQPTRFGVYPANLSIAVLTTTLSRLVGFQPGIVFGTPGGVDIDMDGDVEGREVLMQIATLTVVIIFGVGGWGLIHLLRSQGDRTLSGEQLAFVAPLAQLGMTLGFALFVVALETAFFEMVPFSLTMGSRIFRWNPVVWGVLFVPIFFAATHTLLNPQGAYLEPFTQTPMLLLSGATIIMASVLAWFWVLFRFFDPPHIEAQRRRAAYQARQQAQRQPPQSPPHGTPPPVGGYPPQQPHKGYPPQGDYPPRRDPPSGGPQG